MSLDDIICFLRNHRTLFVVFGIDIIVQVLNDLGKLFLGLLVQIRHCNTTLLVYLLKSEDIPSSKDGIVGMFGGHVSRSLGSKIVEFNSRHSLFINLVHRQQ